jgi:hypothetical protein
MTDELALLRRAGYEFECWLAGSKKTFPQSWFAELTPALRVNRGVRLRFSKRVTRGLPDGWWDPTKITRIQNSMSQAAFLLSVDGVALSQVDG